MSHFSEIYYPNVKIVLVSLNSVWQVKASFKKGTQRHVRVQIKLKESTYQ